MSSPSLAAVHLTPVESPSGFTEAPLNAAQQQVVDLLGMRGTDPPRFDPGLRHELRAELETGLEPLLGALPEGEPLYLSKYPLAQVHGCEARFVAARQAGFSWTVSAARGSV